MNKQKIFLSKSPKQDKLRERTQQLHISSIVEVYLGLCPLIWKIRNLDKLQFIFERLLKRCLLLCVNKILYQKRSLENEFKVEELES